MDNNEQFANNLAGQMCSKNCGFHGSPAFDGMCSKCYKEVVNKKNAAPSTTPRAVSSSSDRTDSPKPETLPTTSCELVPQNDSEKLETAVPTVSVPSTSKDSSEEGAAAATSNLETNTPEKPKKKNRCKECRVKVGLLGFGCRCGGLFCSSHRYSDQHACQFDYKKEGEEQIRKNNPVVVGAKIQKL